MLANWYFCCCMKFTPGRTRNYLMILDTLSGNDTDERLWSIAVEQLTYADKWSRLYALPYVLDSIDRMSAFAKNNKTQVSGYFASIIKTIPSKLQKSYRELLSYFEVQRSESEICYNKIIDCIEPATENICSVSSDTPYIDIVEHAGIGVLLSIIEYKAKNDSSFIVFLNSKLKNNKIGPLFNKTIREAGKGAYGRFSIIRATAVVKYFPTSGLNFANLLRKGLIGYLNLEPDLLGLYVKQLFDIEDLKSVDGKTMVAEKLLLEAEELRKLPVLRGSRNDNGWFPVIKRFEIQNNEKYIRTALEATFWQLILWESAVLLSPEKAFESLSELWVPIITRDEYTFTLEIENGNNYSNDIANRFKCLHICRMKSQQIRNYSIGKLTLDIQHRKLLRIPSGLKKLLYSPWIHYNIADQNDNGVNRKSVLYPRNLAKKGRMVDGYIVAVIRQTFSSYLGVKILKSYGGNDNNKNILLFIAHVFHSLHGNNAQLGTWMRGFLKTEDEECGIPEDVQNAPVKLSFPATGLSVFSLEQIIMAGVGVFDKITPDNFISLIPKQSDDSWESGYRIAGDSWFSVRVLPTVLSSWVLSAMWDYHSYDYTKRWWELIPILSESYKYLPECCDTKFYPLEVIFNMLIVRFLMDDYSVFDSLVDYYKGEIDWRNNHKVGHRNYLITRRDLNVTDWLSIDNVTMENIPRLVYMVERISTLKREQPDIRSQFLNNYSDDIRKNLEEMEDGQRLLIDRYIRLRLIELIDEDVIKNCRDLQETIVSTIIEIGPDIFRTHLLKKLFRTDENGVLLIPENDWIRLYVLKSTLKLLFKYKALENKADSGIGNRMQNPRTVLSKEMGRYELENEILRITYGISLYYQTNDNKIARNLYSLINDLQLNTTTPNLRMKAFSVIKNRTTINVENGYRQYGMDPRYFSIVTVDHNSDSALIGYKDPYLNRVESFFNKNWDEIEILLKKYQNRSLFVEAVVAAVDRVENRCLLNVGLPELLTCNFNGCYVQGGHLQINVTCQNNGVLKVKNSNISKVNATNYPGDITTVELHEDRTADNWLCYTFFKDDQKVVVRNQEWNADISRKYRTSGAIKNSRSVKVVHNASSLLKPYDYSIIDFILGPVYEANGNPIVCTYINTVDNNAEIKWRFSARPGQNFIFSSNDFTDYSADAIKKVLFDKDSSGLLITLTPQIHNNRVKLDLVSNPQENNEFENLKVPFDFRNIKWRKLFDSEEEHEDFTCAEKTDNGWIIKLETNRIDGFPETIKVDISGYVEPHKNYLELDLSRKNWNYHEGILKNVRPVPTYSINLSGGVLEDEFKRLTSIENGCVLNLMGTVGRSLREYNCGIISCKTSEGLIVQVELESLSMKLIGEREYQNLSSMLNDRKAVVVDYVEKRNVEVKYNRSSVGVDIREGMIGILTSKPRNEGAICDTHWRDQHVVKPIPIEIENHSELKVGSLLEVKRDEYGLKIVARNRIIKVRALWEKEDADKNDGLTYLGYFYSGDKRGILTQKIDGKIVIFDNLIMDSNSYLEEIRNSKVIGNRRGITSETMVEINSTGSSWYDPDFKTRISINVGNKLLTGFCSKRIQHGLTNPAQFRGMHYTLNEVTFEGKTYFECKRKINLININDNEEDAIDFTEEFNRYLENPYNLEAVRKGNIVRISEINQKYTMVKGSSGWTKNVKLGSNKEHGPYITSKDEIYNNKCIIRIVEETEEEFIASFRKVPPFKLDEYFDEITASGEYFKEIRGTMEPCDLTVYLKTPLRYVGPEKKDEKNITDHRFEWGYGKTVLIPENRLKWGNEEFNRAEFVLFHGDGITKLHFKEDSVNGVLLKVMAIEESDVQFTDATTIYRQRADHKIVHILRLVRSGNEYKVDAVDGFEERSYTDDEPLRNMKVNASVNDELDVNEQSDKVVIMGRLCKAIFESSRGKNVIFNKVRFTMDGEYSLKRDELIFVKANEIFKRGNETLLSLSPVELLDSDIGDDMRGLSITRRSFSVREDQLERVRRRSQGDRLKGCTLPVRIRQNNQGLVIALMIDQSRNMVIPVIPSRSIEAFIGNMRLAQERLFYGIVTRISNQNHGRTIQLQLKPGVFIQLNENVMTADLELIEKGMTVRISLFDEKVKLEQAENADAKYVNGDTPRISVLLPKNTMKREAENDNVGMPSYWRNLGARKLTFGDLPDMTCFPKSQNNIGELIDPRSNEWVELMETKHPKYVQLYCREDGYYVAPVRDKSNIGHIAIDRNTWSAAVVTLEESNTPRKSTLRTLTFGDNTSLEICERTTDRKWRYHDDMVVKWENGKGLLENYEDHTSLCGPVFFLSEYNVATLRYNDRNINNYGLPVRALIDALEKKGKKIFVVAGISQNGIWVEISPGRISELPKRMLVHEMGTSGVCLLEHFAFQYLATGDELKLGISGENSDDPWVPDCIALKEWCPGIRGALGLNRNRASAAYLPVEKTLEDEGGVVLGAGKYQLTLPCSKEEIPSEGEIICFTYDNRILDMKCEKPQSGYLVMVTAGGKMLEVAGFSGYEYFFASQECCWDGMPEEIVPKNSDGNSRLINPEVIINVIVASGGALPGTITRIDLKGERIELSFENLLKNYNPEKNQVVLGTALGVFRINNEPWVVLRIGSWLRFMKMHELFNGAPSNAAEKILATIEDCSVSMWFTIDTVNNIKSGLKKENDSGGEFRVRAVCAVINDIDGEFTSGVVCQSVATSKLYWLPKNKIGWAELNDRELEIWVKGKRNPFKVTLVNASQNQKDIISVVDTEEIQQEFADLHIGFELPVRIVSCRRGRKDAEWVYIAETIGSEIVLELVNFNGRLADYENREETVEIFKIVQDNNIVVQTVISGQRQVFLDLPENVFQNKEDNQTAKPDEFITKVIEYTENKFNNIENEFDSTGWNSCLEKLKRIENGEHITLQETIAVILILAIIREQNREMKHMEVQYREKSISLLSQLNLRLIHSKHVEILGQLWVYNSENRNKNTLIWSRLSQILEGLQGTLRSGISKKIGKQIENLFRVVEMRDLGNSDVRIISHSLMASMGRRADLELISSFSENINKIHQVSRGVMNETVLLRKLEDVQIRDLFEILKSLILQGVDIPLLEPVLFHKD